ncbi:MAG: PDZ domain-containing protein [Hyphomonadaceae bacterium]|nr:PDZ domain-containing protein [Hyphomonadaceae bacterium]
MRLAIRPALAVVAAMGLMLALSDSGRAEDWPWLGVIITDTNGSNLEGYGGSGGSYVTGIESAGPAFTAGLLRHDIIIAVDGLSTVNTRELTCLIQGKRPGDTVLVTVMRAGRQTSLPATLGRWPESREFPRPALAHCGRDPVSGLRGGQPAAALPVFAQRMTA